MSSVAVVPPPNSSSLLRTLPRLTQRARALLTTLNLHFAGVAALAVIDLYLLVHLVLVWQALSNTNADALDQQRATLRAAQVAAMPLRGLDTKLVESTEAANEFYAARLPFAYSQVAAELGVLTRRQGVRLSRVQYAQSPVLSGTDELAEVRMDVSIAGDYRPVVQFINAVERDRMFFVIGSLNLTGQQSGQVNLRMHVTTYLRQPNAQESLAQMPPTSASASGTATGNEVTPAPAALPAGGAR